jgi:hypothetical protein
MRLVTIFLVVLVLSSCTGSKKPASLPDALLMSLRENNFDRLSDYFPTVELYKRIEKDKSKSDEEIKKILEEFMQKQEASWKTILERVKERKIDLEKVKIKETISYKPFEEKMATVMVIVYDYEGKDWDDIGILAAEWNNKLYLLEIPAPTKWFSFSDPELNEAAEARMYVETQKPEFRKSLDERARLIIAAAQTDNLAEFQKHAAYIDEENQKVTPIDSTNVKLQRAIYLMHAVKNSIEGCNEFNFGQLWSERESEGTWHILEMQCSNRSIQFAFLKTGDQFLLGDIEVEGD